MHRVFENKILSLFYLFDNVKDVFLLALVSGYVRMMVGWKLHIERAVMLLVVTRMLSTSRTSKQETIEHGVKKLSPSVSNYLGGGLKKALN